jgi:hypothetical protein
LLGGLGLVAICSLPDRRIAHLLLLVPALAYLVMTRRVGTNWLEPAIQCGLLLWVCYAFAASR